MSGKAFSESSSEHQVEPILENALNEIEQSVPGESQEIYEFLIETMHESDESNLLRSLSPSEVTSCIEMTLEEIESFSTTSSPQVTSQNPSFESDNLHNYSIHTVVSRNNPFIVDSIIEKLTSDSIAVEHLYYTNLPKNFFEIDQPTDQEPFLLVVFTEQIEKSQFTQIEDEIYEIFGHIDCVVDDFQPMLDKAEQVKESLSSGTTGGESSFQQPNTIQNFIDFLINDNFVFLGYFESRGKEEENYDNLLGLCQIDSTLDLSLFTSEKNNKSSPEDDLMLFYKTNVQSKVYRKERLDSIAFQIPENNSQDVTKYVFIGLFTNRVLSQPSVQIPVLHEKFNAITERENIAEHTHHYRDLYTIYNSMPKHLLLMLDVDEIISDLNSILKVRGERTFKLRARPIAHREGISLMILMEQDRFSGAIRQKMQSEIKEVFDASSIDYQLSLGDGSLARLHFDVETKRMNPLKSSFEQLERNLYELTRTWEDKTQKIIKQRHEHESGKKLLKKFDDVFTDEYKALVEPKIAATDINILHQLESGQITPPSINFSDSSNNKTTRLAIYHTKKCSLNKTLPILSNHGFKIEQQSNFKFKIDKTILFLHVFEVTDEDGNSLNLSNKENILSQSLRGILLGEYRDDSLNHLIYEKATKPRFLNLFRLYKNYFHQHLPAIKLNTINRTLTDYRDITEKICRYFEIKFDPTKSSSNRLEKLNSLEREILTDLESINNRTPYQVLSFILKFIKATDRTNFYQRDYPENKFQHSFTSQRADGKHYISVKINCSRLTDLETGSTKYEIFVYSPFMEGIHLRSGDIARGGIRWSDRRDDYRTEIMELMETQKKKNALIVPVGAKGGFVVKEEYLPEKTSHRNMGRQQYEVFMRGLLDITDNRSDGEVKHPPNVICYDGDDPYFVVAADKGTAEFSDLANKIARKYNFWLSDAFASGGSSGYDHKELGITSRGCWECVKRHFRELGLDYENETFSVTGIGDMGGDVFGNGLILSKNMKLVGAFNHRHIFIDPDPEPQATFEERKRLYNTEESGWDNYDKSLISEGGGVFDRNTSLIALEEPAQNLLGFEKPEQAPENVIKAILKADVDLLWNGGIGTYIKSSNESHGSVEDPQNDPFRVDANKVDADVIGEGGNLGITQEGRVELDQNGVRLNTDFLDNSGGVDLSDKEVNLKILFGKSLEKDELDTIDNRNNWLDRYEQFCVDQVIEHNKLQSGAISLEVSDSADRIEDFRSLIDQLEENTNLNRSAESLPDVRELQDRQRTNRPMTRPETAVILSYAKQDLYRKSLDESWPSQTIIQPFLKHYFPETLPEEFPRGLETHPLRKEIAITGLINYSIDNAGCSFFYSLRDQLGCDLIQVIKAYRTADMLGNGQAIRQELTETTPKFSTETKYEAWRRLNERLGHAVNWFIDTINESLVYHGFQRGLMEEIDQHFDTILETLKPRQEEYYQKNYRYWTENGFSQSTAKTMARLSYLVPALEVITIARDSDIDDFRKLSSTYFELGRKLHVDWIIRQVFESDGRSRWDDLALRSMGVEVHNIQREILKRMLRNDHSLDDFLTENKSTINRLDEIQINLMQEDSTEFSAYQYMVQRMRSLV